MRLGFCSPKKGTPWGGSEELWSETALELQRRGHHIGVSYPHFTTRHPRLDELQHKGARLYQLHPRVKGLIKRITGRNISAHWLPRFKPDFVLHSLDTHDGDLSSAAWCFEHDVPYAVLFQVANRHRWISPRRLDGTRDVLCGAAACFFVSDENRRIVEDQIASKIEKAEIVPQSFSVAPDASVGWPGDGPPWRLACVGRLHFPSKAQDLLVEVFRQPKWREREIQVNFWGKDNGSEEHLRRLIDLHGMQDRLQVAGVSDSIEQVWATHHALLLPSRYEGNARVLLEAMVCRRIGVATPVGRAHEIIDDGETGFLAQAARPELFDLALERAWERRDEWHEMGQLAGERIRDRCSMTPVQDLADRLETLARGRS
jgi:glycosyltransferase involved in cell wall biosynthesis